MLRALIRKDLVVLGPRLWFPVVAVAFALAMAGGKATPAMLTSMMLHMSMTALLGQVAMIEEKSRGEILLNVLPLSRRQIVAGRYGFLVFGAVVLTAGSGLALATLDVASGRPAAGLPLAYWWTATVSFLVLVNSISLPVVFAFGPTDGQTWANLLAATPLLAPLLLFRYQVRWFYDLTAAVSRPSLATGAAALAAALLLAYLSYRLAARMYERRDL